MSTDQKAQLLIDRLRIRAEAAKENPTIGESDLLEDAWKMIYDLRNRLRFRKDYDRDRAHI